MNILFVGKKNNRFTEKAVHTVKSAFPSTTVVLGERGNKFPSSLLEWKGDLIISYLSPWIIPAVLLKNASFASINFHTGPPEYPGIGCTNFALYDNQKQYGVTCHHMLPKVDTGKIIAVRRFELLQNDTVFSLTERCYEHLFELINDVVSKLQQDNKLPESNEQWTRKPYTRAELNALCEIKLDMSEEEVMRRIRATTFPNMPGAYFDLYGKRFYFSDK